MVLHIYIKYNRGEDAWKRGKAHMKEKRKQNVTGKDKKYVLKDTFSELRKFMAGTKILWDEHCLLASSLGISEAIV